MATESIALLESLIADARSKREKIDDEITSIEERLKLLRKMRSELHDEEVVLTRTLYRQSATDYTSGTTDPTIIDKPGPTSIEADDDDWSRAGRAEAVEKALAELTNTKGFASPTEIEELLKQHNRTGDTRDYIGASLAYLRRTNKAYTRARAEWVCGPE